LPYRVPAVVRFTNVQQWKSSARPGLYVVFVINAQYIQCWSAKQVGIL